MQQEYVFSGDTGIFSEYEASGDLGIRAQGTDLLSAVAAAAHGLVALLLPPEAVRDVEVRTISAQGRDDQEMIVNLLNDMLFLIYGHRWLPKHINTLILHENGQVEASFVGEPLTPERHHIDREIKAVTYHNLSIVHGHSEVTIDLLCDL
jgi:SHS2 domain-containing protein